MFWGSVVRCIYVYNRYTNIFKLSLLWVPLRNTGSKESAHQGVLLLSGSHVWAGLWGVLRVSPVGEERPGSGWVLRRWTQI